MAAKNATSVDLPRVTVVLGATLVVVGVVGYLATGAEHPTALIPAALGVLLVVAGQVGRAEARRGAAMHVAAALGLLGLLGTFPGLLKLPALLTGGDVERPAAVVAQSVTAVLCGGFVAACVRSFANARRPGVRS